MRRILVFLVAGVLAASLAAPAAAMAGPFGQTYFVGPPTGNDTAVIQAALNKCIGAGPNCTVQLGPWTYHTSQLYTADFVGTFRGMGMGVTTLASLPSLTVNWYDPGLGTPECIPGATGPGGNACAWPVYVTFLDGTVEVSDLTIDTSATTISSPYPWFGGTSIDLAMALDFEFDTRIDASVDRVGVRGGFDTNSENKGGIWSSDFNTDLGINYGTSAAAASGGSFAVRDSSVQDVVNAITPGPVINAPVTIVGNTISDVDAGIVANGPSGTFEISHNRIGADNLDPAEWDHDGILIGPSGYETGLASRFSIHDNAITAADTCGCSMFGIVLNDAVQLGYGVPPVPHWFTATVVNNTISLPGSKILPSYDWKEGIQLNNTSGTMVIANTIASTSTTGAGDAIGIYGQNFYWWYNWPLPTGTPPSTRNVVLGNNVRGFTPQGTLINSTYWPGLGTSQYYLDQNTSNNLVVCTNKNDTSADLGSGNHVVNCTKVVVPEAAVTPVVTPQAASACHADLPALLKRQP